MSLVVTVPAAGTPVVAADIQTIADEIADYTSAVPSGDVDGVGAHSGEHAPGGSDNLDGSYVGIGPAVVAAGTLILRLALSLRIDNGDANRCVEAHSVGAAVTLFPTPGAGLLEFTFAGMDVAAQYVTSVTQYRDPAAGVVPRQIALFEQPGNRMRVYTTDSAGAALYLNDNDEVHILIYEIAS